ncbi:SagB/ThcOx family dehydrogenase [Chloroflexota bacterium]|nr:SagB/ThcOx family dehydrogenase [Chloroflexota bacterium]
MIDQTRIEEIKAELIQKERDELRAYKFTNTEVPDECFTSDQMSDVPAPPLEKAIPADAILIDLPSIDEISLGTMPLIQVFKKRRSHRVFTDEHLSIEELAFLCWSVAGVHEIGPKNIWTKRTSPSGGARHPFETYLVVQRVEGLEPGIYRYSGLQNKLVLVKTGSDFCQYLADNAMQNFVKDSAVVFIWTVVPYRNEWRYLFTSAREMAMDIGHYCENLYLAAESIGTGTCGVASYEQDLLDEMLEVDGKDEFTIYIAPVGRITE